MKENFRDCFGKLKRYRQFIVCLVLVFFIAGAAGVGLTKEKAQGMKIHKISKEDVKIKNIGCTVEEINPLRKDEYPELNSAVKKYFDEIKKDEKFAEKYDDIHVYTKVGQYRDTYIVFAQYRMKIKDIYTEVPGLATLYASKDEKSGEYQIDTKKPEGQEKDYLQSLLQHKDVRHILSEAEEEFNTALQSDAILRESLMDLKDAYKNSDS